MIASIYYKHQEGDHVLTSRFKKSDADEMFVCFQPEENETLPFPEGINCVPFSKFVEWMNEMNGLYDTLAKVADTEYNNLLTTV